MDLIGKFILLTREQKKQLNRKPTLLFKVSCLSDQWSFHWSSPPIYSLLTYANRWGDLKYLTNQLLSSTTAACLLLGNNLPWVYQWPIRQPSSSTTQQSICYCPGPGVDQPGPWPGHQLCQT